MTIDKWKTLTRAQKEKRRRSVAKAIETVRRKYHDPQSNMRHILDRLWSDRGNI